MWTNPLSLRPMSTKAPKSTTLRTVPLSSMPGCKSSSLRMPFLNMGGAHAAQLQKLLPVLESPVLFPVIDQLARHHLIQSGNVTQQRHARRVQVHTDQVHAGLDNTIERLFELAAANVMLIEAHTDV